MIRTLHSKEFYKENKTRLMTEYSNRPGFINPGKALANKMKLMQGVKLTESDLKKVEVIFAKQVIDELTDRAKAKMQEVKRIQQNPSCLGYTTQTQDISNAHEIVEQFEFECYLISELKEILT